MEETTMAKFHGNIGFVVTEEDPDNPGVWDEKEVEKEYSGDIIKVMRKLQTTSSTVNDNVTISNEISIVADPYANNNMYAMRYVVWNGVKWKIETISAEYPRLKLFLGGVYNG